MTSSTPFASQNTSTPRSVETPALKTSVGHMAPSLYLSHGAPDLSITAHPARRFFETLGAQFETPKGILIVSAHWRTPRLAITEPGPLSTIHDFRGFPAPLYALTYPAKATPSLVETVRTVLEGAPHGPAITAPRGLDHGAWVPLRLAFPAADIPVVQLSLPAAATPRELYAIGQRLAPLRRDDIMVVGSGSAVHNLYEITADGTPPPDWATHFDTWLHDRLMDWDLDALFDFERLAPDARRAHPTSEHLTPLFIAMGAAGDAPAPKQIHQSFTYGSVGMASYSF